MADDTTRATVIAMDCKGQINLGKARSSVALTTVRIQPAAVAKGFQKPTRLRLSATSIVALFWEISERQKKAY